MGIVRVCTCQCVLAEHNRTHELLAFRYLGLVGLYMRSYPLLSYVAVHEESNISQF